MTVKNGTCSAPNCGYQRIYPNGLCTVHSRRLKFTGSLDIPLDACPVAGCESESVTVNGPRQGLCSKHQQQSRKYNLPRERFLALYASNGGLCAVCLLNRGDTIDHDHECCVPMAMKGGSWSCGKCVRAVLCGPCNRVLGMMNEDRQRLQRAINYLDSFEAE